MKKIYSLMMMLLSVWMASAQTLVLNVNGENPDPLKDKTTKNDVKTSGTVTSSNGEIVFTNGISYLYIDSLQKQFNINQDWSFECKLKVTDSTNQVAIIDYRSTSTTGNMYFYYNRDGKGLHFGDRNLNGDMGHLVADYQRLPQNTWVTVKLEYTGGHFKILRNGVITKDTIFSGTLSAVSKTTIGYSEDRRDPHAVFYMDDIKLYGSGAATGISPLKQDILYAYPNPAESVIYIGKGQLFAKLFITDAQGRIITEWMNTPVCDIHGLKAGIYFIFAQTPEGKMTSARFVKQ